MHLVRSRGAAAKPRNRALAGRSIVFLLVPICKRTCMDANKKTIATFVTTVSRLGGEDKNILQAFLQCFNAESEPFALANSIIIVYNASMNS